MNLRRVIHNYINPDQGLKRKTPAEAAEIDLGLETNKLLDLIQFLKDNYVRLSWQYL